MKRYLFPSLILPIIFATSCQKVINVDLNSADPQYVIEANITDKAGPQTVHIARTANFSDKNSFPQVTGAFVTIKDVTSGAIDTLKEDSAGYYNTRHLAGISGHQYDLYIKTGDRVFTSSSTMPLPVDIDSIYTEKSVFGGNDLFPVPVYTDPIMQGNRYLMTVSVNHIPIRSSDVRGDQVTNGQVSKFPFYYDTDDDSGNPKIEIGDSVFVTLRTIDNNVYEFYRTLEDTKDQNSASLSNPLTNIIGGALGYFNAGPSRTKGMLVK